MFCTTQSRLSEVTRSIAEKLANSKNVVVLTGAGISAESGIPTFRGAGGLWRNFSATKLATPDAFSEDPALVWQFYEHRRNVVAKCKPNGGHYALSKIEELLTQAGHQEEETRDGNPPTRTFTLLTQNIDRLHHAAGSNPKNIVELHGSLWLVKPVDHRGFLEETGKVWEDRNKPICSALSEEICANTLSEFQKTKVRIEDLPHDPDGSGLLRPAVVWFGEALDERVLKRAMDSIDRADVLMIVGTSGVVYPAAAFGSYVRKNGGTVIHFNLDAETAGIDKSDIGVFGPSGESLPLLASSLEKVLAS